MRGFCSCFSSYTPVQPFSMHLAFLGAPGTGKTEVARLYGQILKETGVLSEGRVICVSGSDVVRSDVEKLFDKARGSVLFIDEAYAMTSASITISELIAHMENRRDDTVVILAGYEGEMNRLLDSNPGFRSRIGFTLHFAEYDEDELLEIFDLMCRRADLKVEDDAHRSVRDLLARNGRRPDQGNARYVRKLFEDCLGAQQARLAGELDCRIQFHGRDESLTLIAEYINNNHPSVRAEYTPMAHWNELPQLAAHIADDHLFVVVTARKGTISYKNALERLPDELQHHFSGKNLMIIFPDQYGDQKEDCMSFTEAQHHEESSIYDWLLKLLHKSQTSH